MRVEGVHEDEGPHSPPTHPPPAHTHTPTPRGLFSLVETVVIPTRVGGTASSSAPQAPATDRSCAWRTDRTESTRWKYDCHGIDPSV